MYITQKIFNIFSSPSFIKFFIVGVSAFLVDLLILNFMVFYIFKGEDKTFFNIISISKFVSSTIGLILSFSLNKIWAFDAAKKTTAPQIAKFAVVTVINIIYVSVMYAVLYPIVSIFILSSIAITLTNIFVEGVKMITTYFFYKYFVFE